jgi:hypothetical protein
LRIKSDGEEFGMLKVVKVSMLVVACATGGAAAHEHKSDGDPSAALEKIKSWFVPEAIVNGPQIVDCTLSGGTQTHCFSITLKAEPYGYSAGPWCPGHISDGPEKSGIWFDKGKIYAADGPFIANLKTFYNDDGWQMFDPQTGKVKVKAEKEGCDVAGDPRPNPENRNYCIECDISHMPAARTMTFVIPIEPVPLSGAPSEIDRNSGVGISFNGPRFDGPAPLRAILSSYSLGLLDKCGGHVNPHVGYHIHAVTDCNKEIATKDVKHAAMIGIAMDGYPMTERLDGDGKEPDDLDSCRGHSTPGIGYHYHVAAPGKNAILSCLKGETGCAFEGGAQTCDATMWGSIRRTIGGWVGWQ